MRRFGFFLAMGLIAWSAWPSAAREERTPGLSLNDSTGSKHAIGANAKATVLFFAAVECPAANRYLNRIVALHKEFAAKGVTFFAIYPNALDSAAEVGKKAKDENLPFPALLDPEQRVTDRYGVKTTPTAVLLDADGKVRYFGMVDDHKTESLVKNRFLKNAVESLLDSKEITIVRTEPVGCTIQRRLETKQNAPVTYANRVASILHKNCANCHRPGQVAPFSLLNYDQAQRWAENIKSYTQSRAMPPWKPANHGLFLGERGLSKDEIDVLAKWADAGAPLGDAAAVPAPPQFPEGWALGQPDLILSMPEFDVDPVGTDEYRCFILDPKILEDRYVQAVEFHPGNARIVHHVMTYIDAFGAAEKMMEKKYDPKPGFASRGTGPGFFPAGDLGGWGPGMQPVPLPDGTAMLFPGKAKIVMEVHYHKNGRNEKDRTQLGIHFAKKPVTKRVRSQVVLNLTFKLPPGAKRHEVTASWTTREDLHAVAIIPHMHLIGKEIQVVATLPDGTEKKMVHVPDWDFNWQETYRFKTPFPLPKGTTVTVTGWFDNSAANPNNPNNPPRQVRFGEQTTDEMCVAYIAYTKDVEE